jgi:hypothetical protein
MTQPLLSGSGLDDYRGQESNLLRCMLPRRL